MKPSMITAIAAPMTSVMNKRVSLQRTWSSSYVLTYVSANIAAIAVAIIAPNRR